MKRIVIVGALAALLVILTLAGCSATPVTVKPTPTAGASGQGGLTGEHIIAEGHVTPVKSASLSFATGGIVTQVSVAVGERVQAGQVLARLDDSLLQKQIAQAQAQLEIARKQLDQASAQAQLADKQFAQLKAGGTDAAIAAAQAALNAARANADRVKQGPTADALAQLKANLDNAQAARDQAQSAYDRAGGASNPYIGLTREALALQQATNAYIAAQAAYNEARSHPTAAELAAANAQIQQAQAGLAQLTPGKPALDVAQAQVNSAQAAQASAQAQVNSAQAALETAQAQATNYVLVAPFTGTVMTLDVNPGEFATPGIAVLRLADTAWQIETTDLTELNITRVSEGTPATMTFDAIPGLELPGHVARIRPYGDTKQGDIVYTVIITPDQQDVRLRWNMTAKVTLTAK
ncbi:MAG: efflux RND transporter periplasmic adaptor subunit [Anaerolineae bacterium]